MDKEIIVQMLESIQSHIEDIRIAHNDRLEGRTTTMGRIPALTQNPMGEIYAREIASSMGMSVTPLKEHPIDEVITFALMSLEVEMGNLLGGFEIEEE